MWLILFPRKKREKDGHYIAHSFLFFVVMIYIHGGSFIFGGIQGNMTNGINVAAEKGIVIVTVAYRLGALGFLAHPSLNDDANAGAGAQGNLAVLDIQIALEWVHAHIESFGGDQEQVTVAGESAGAYLACLYMLMPAKRKLLKGVIMESGACVAQPLEQALARGQEFAEATGCAIGGKHRSTGEDALACLKSLPLDILIPTSSYYGELTYHYWQPTVDGFSTLLASPAELLQNNSEILQTMPVLLGTNQDEGTLFLPATGLDKNDSDAAYVHWVTSGEMETDEGFPPLSREVRRVKTGQLTWVVFFFVCLFKVPWWE